MFRKTNLVLTYASGSELFTSNTFWVYIKSLRNIQDADYVILTHDISEDNKNLLIDAGIEVVNIPAKEMHFLFQDRHLSFWRYLNNHGYKYKYVLVTDCRDVMFQANPFDWITEWKSRFDNIQGNKNFLDHFVILMSEGFKMRQSGFACIEHFEFQRDIPRPYLKDDRERWVINGGTIMGSSRAMQEFHFLVWISTMKSIGRCTDQATINWLMYYLEKDDTYNVSFPQHDHLCLTGEGVKEGAVEPILKDGKLYSPQEKLYYMVHQWDRLQFFNEDILAQYA